MPCVSEIVQCVCVTQRMRACSCAFVRVITTSVLIRDVVKHMMHGRSLILRFVVGAAFGQRVVSFDEGAA